MVQETNTSVNFLKIEISEIITVLFYNIFYHPNTANKVVNDPFGGSQILVFSVCSNLYTTKKYP